MPASAQMSCIEAPWKPGTHEAALRGREDFGATVRLQLRIGAAHEGPPTLAAQQYENERSLAEMAFRKATDWIG